MNDYLICKRVFDFIIAYTFLIIMSPLMICIATIILVVEGRPILYFQERIGKNGELFRIIKYRTMIVNAISKGTGIFTDKCDKRITLTGRVLRKSSLDELPQIVNVLKGEMSLVGPRPPLPYYPYTFSEYNDNQKTRFNMLPGLTGYAQIRGRNSIEWKERFVFDEYYINKSNFWFDMNIILKTFVKIVQSENIY